MPPSRTSSSSHLSSSRLDPYKHAKQNGHRGIPETKLSALSRLPLDKLLLCYTDVPESKNGRQNERLKLADLQAFKILGVGGISTVCVARHNESRSSLFAVKVTDKAIMREWDALGLPRLKDRESSALAHIDWSPFVTGLVGQFTDDRAAYLALEYVPARTLTSIQAVEGGIPASQIRFYFSGISLALHYLHEQGILHGDIKGDNVLVGADGYPVLTDFGNVERICAIEENSTWKDDLEGTLEFMTPERLEDRPNPDQSATTLDWWALGCVLFEMIAQRAAFGQDHDDEQGTNTKAAIIEGRPTIPIAELPCNSKAKDMVSRLLCWDVKDRIGADGLGLREIRDHPWMDNIDWAKLQHKKYPAPKTFEIDLMNIRKWDRISLEQLRRDAGPDLQTNVAAVDQSRK